MPRISVKTRLGVEGRGANSPAHGYILPLPDIGAHRPHPGCAGICTRLGAAGGFAEALRFESTVYNGDLFSPGDIAALRERYPGSARSCWARRSG